MRVDVPSRTTKRRVDRAHTGGTSEQSARTVDTGGDGEVQDTPNRAAAKYDRTRYDGRSEAAQCFGPPAFGPPFASLKVSIDSGAGVLLDTGQRVTVHVLLESDQNHQKSGYAWSTLDEDGVLIAAAASGGGLNPEMLGSSSLRTVEQPCVKLVPVSDEGEDRRAVGRSTYGEVDGAGAFRFTNVTDGAYVLIARTLDGEGRTSVQVSGRAVEDVHVDIDSLRGPPGHP